MGANPSRKDLFLEIDCLVAANHAHCPLQGAIQAVVQSFANAPVNNLDGTTGIQLHVDIGNLYGHAANTGNQPKVLEMQLLATYFNLATRRINAATLSESKTADRLGLHNVAEAAIYAMNTLALPVNVTNSARYSDATKVLDEINSNKSEVY